VKSLQPAINVSKRGRSKLLRTALHRVESVQLRLKNLLMFPQRRSSEQIIAAVEKVIPGDEFDAFYNEVELPTVKFLPRRYTFNVGLAVLMRPATKDDTPPLYALIKSVADTGHGYGVDEFPTINAFRSMISDVYVIVVEEQRSNKVRNIPTQTETILQLAQTLVCPEFF